MADSMENTSQLEPPGPSQASANSSAGKRTQSNNNGLDPVGIRKIDTQKIIFEKNLGCSTKTDNPKDIIDKMMEKCDTKVQQLYPFEPEKFHDTIRPNSDIYYHICIYRQTITSKDKNLQHFLEGIPEIHNIQESKSYNTIYFFYRPGSEIPGQEKDCEIYALPYKHAYSFIQWAVDFNFPKLIARRLLSEKGQLQRTAAYLVENRTHSKVTLKDHATSSKLYDIEDLKGVIAEVRPDSSLFDLPIDLFKTEDGTQPVRDLKIEKGQGFVKILKSLTKVDFAYLLDHLTRIYRRETTYKYDHIGDPDHKEPDCYIHDSQFEPVESSEIKKALTTSFDSDIATLLTRGEGTSRLDGFEFVHKKSEDFVRGEEYSLYYYHQKEKRQEQFHIFNHQPSLDDIFEESRNYLLTTELRTSLLNASNIERVTKSILIKFKAISLQFKIGNQAQIPVKVYGSIQGDTVDVDKGKVYWRKTGGWFHILGEQVVQMHTEFVRKLRQVLIEEGSEHDLKHKWLRKVQQELVKVELTNSFKSWENIYNLSYSGEGYEDYLVGDKNITQGKIELFDILKIVEIDDKKHAYLYHVKKSLSSDTRVALAQLQAAAQIIRGARKGNKDEIKNVYVNASSGNPTFMAKFGITNVDEFIQLFQNSTFVYAFVDPSDKGERRERRMADESNLYTELSEPNIIACLKGHREKLVKAEPIPIITWAKLIHEKLRDQGYIDAIDQPTSKFLYATFEVNGLKELRTIFKKCDEIVWRLLIKKFRSAYKSLVPKLEILRVDLKNFDFKICEIRVDDKDDLPDVHKRAISLFKKLSDEAKEKAKKNKKKRKLSPQI